MPKIATAPPTNNNEAAIPIKTWVVFGNKSKKKVVAAKKAKPIANDFIPSPTDSSAFAPLVTDPLINPNAPTAVPINSRKQPFPLKLEWYLVIKVKKE